jgi:putative ABC transport system permease protein
MDRSSLRIAFRTLGRHKGFTVVAVLSIAVAIALNTVMYSLMDAMLDPQVSARNPESIYGITYYGVRERPVPPEDIAKAVGARFPGFEGLTGARRFVSSFRTEPLAENGNRYMRVAATVVRPNYFDFLGTQPMEGRTFVERDENTPVAVISDRLARKLFPDESPIGRAFTLDGEGLTVIGVVRRNGTFGPLMSDLWRLREARAAPVGVTLMRFREAIDQFTIGDQLKDVAAQLALSVGATPGATSFRGRQFVTRNMVLNSFHYALIGAVIAVLLVACANLANLQLARGLARTRELALRSAVGASRRQLIEHLVLESALLAVTGLALGIALTTWGVHLVRTSIPPAIEDYIIEPQTSWKMFVVAASAALLCVFLVGLIPALHISRVDPDTLLKSGSGTGANKAHRRRYGMMVVAQIGFALPILIGAIVVFNGSWRMHSRNWLVRELYGYDPTPLIVANVPIVAQAGNDVVVRMADVAAELTARAKAIPGVIDASVVFRREPGGRAVTVDDDNGYLREEMAHLWSYAVVSPSYFRTMGRAMERGRDFNEGEFDGTAVIMDAPTARFLWQSKPPLGRAIKFGDAKSELPFQRVVGIVGDLRDTFAIRRYNPNANFRLQQVMRVITPTDSLVLRARLWPARPGNTGVPQRMLPAYLNVSVLARAEGNTELAAIRLNRVLRSWRSGGEQATAVALLDQEGISERRVRQDFVTSLFSTFALLGVALVALGVYGIVSHSVAERKREIAVRISLGAQMRDILRSVLREGNAIVLAGIALGLGFTYFTVGWLQHFFFGEYDGNNSVLFAFIAAGLFGIATLAAFIPALRATRIDPVEALRHE